jgi:hypothetical protein
MDTMDASTPATTSATDALDRLRALGFSAPEAERLLTLKRRWPLGDRGDPGRPGLDEQRLGFARWLVQHGRVSDQGGAA